MNCTEFDSLSMLYFDGDANQQQIIELNEHMSGCSSCRESFEGMKKTLELLETQDEFEIDEGFTRDVMSKISEYEESRVRTAMLIEKTAIPLAAVIFGMGILTWYIILNNIRVGFVLYRIIDFAVLILNAVTNIILHSRITEYLKFINMQLQTILPICIILIGIMYSSDKYYKKDQEKA